MIASAAIDGISAPSSPSAIMCEDRAIARRSLAPSAPLLHAAIKRLRWGEHRGGMFVAVRAQMRKMP
jgi:hypothetical protein